MAAETRSLSLRAFRHRDFRLLWTGLIISNAGTWMQNIALGWMILDLTDNPLYIGLLGFTRAVPLVALSPIGGAVADRLDRRKVLFAAQLGMTISAVALWLLTVTGRIQIWHILLLSAVSAAAVAFEQPTRHSLLPQLVPLEDLLAAMALQSIAFNGATVFGPSLAGAVAAWLGLAGLFLINAISFGAIFIALWLMQWPPHRPGRGTHSTIWQDVGAGLRYVKDSPILLALLSLVAVTSLLARPYQHFLPVFARDLLRLNLTGLGLLATGPGLGTILFSLLQAVWGDRGHKGRNMIIAGLGLAAALAVIGVSRITWLSYLAMVLAGGCGTTFATYCNTLIQQNADDAVRGRVISLWTLTAPTMLQIGQLPMGALMDWLGPTWSVTLLAALTAGAILTIVAWRPQVARLA